MEGLVGLGVSPVEEDAYPKAAGQSCLQDNAQIGARGLRVTGRATQRFQSQDIVYLSTAPRHIGYSSADALG